MKPKLVLLTAVAVVIALAAATAFALSVGTTAPAQASGPAVAAAVPATIPEEGVRLVPGVADIVLMPPAAGEQDLLAISSMEQAIAAAPKIPTPLPATAILAQVTIGSTLAPAGEASAGYEPIENRLAWVITYTYPEPVDVRLGEAHTDTPPPSPAPLLMSHANIIIDAQTGAFLWGFFTR